MAWGGTRQQLEEPRSRHRADAHERSSLAGAFLSRIVLVCALGQVAVRARPPYLGAHTLRELAWPCAGRHEDHARGGKLAFGRWHA